MPNAVTGVTISDNGDGTCGVQVGLFGYTVQKTALFDHSQNQEAVRSNLALAFKIGNYAEPASKEFLTGPGGIVQGPDAKYAIDSIVLVDNDTQTYEVTFTGRQGSFGFQITKDQLRSDDNDPQKVLANLPAFLRLGKFTSLTQAAIDAVKAQRFWY